MNAIVNKQDSRQTCWIKMYNMEFNANEKGCPFYHLN